MSRYPAGGMGCNARRTQLTGRPVPEITRPAVTADTAPPQPTHHHEKAQHHYPLIPQRVLRTYSILRAQQPTLRHSRS